MASHAAIAIQNAELYQQLQTYADELEVRVQQRTIELQEAKEFLEGILASAPDAVFVLDENNQIVQTNQVGTVLMEHAQKNGQNLFDPSFLELINEARVADVYSILEIENRAYQARTGKSKIFSK